jgi:hypothetical protein
VKLRKCSFYHRQIHYLGHITFEEGIQLDPNNIEAIWKWPTPKNLAEVRSFMGLAYLMERKFKLKKDKCDLKYLFEQ